VTKAVFITKVDPTYDDLPENRYHFPRTYLRQVEAAVGDWIVYYEPRRTTGDLSSRGGRQAYFATARVTHIVADPTMADHHYALVADYIEFDRPVPFKDGVFYYEAALKRPDGGTSKGAFGRAVRSLGDAEYDLILRTGFAEFIGPDAAARTAIYDLDEEPAVFERPIVERISRRPFRDAAFAKAVKTAYGDTCAVTGLQIINGGGRSEVQAAHIRPVAHSGPDSVRNGVALCGTVHWMFDRGLLSFDEDYRVLVAGEGVPDTVRRMIREDGKLAVPSRPDLRPHPQFLKYHREMFFKG